MLRPRALAAVVTTVRSAMLHGVLGKAAGRRPVAARLLHTTFPLHGLRDGPPHDWGQAELDALFRDLPDLHAKFDPMVDALPPPQPPEGFYASEDPRDHTYADVGKFYEVSDEDLETYFKEGICGELYKQWRSFSGRSQAILIRPQALEIIECLRKSLINGRGDSRDHLGGHPIVLDGPRGCGKSCVLNHVIHFARKEGWLVVSIPSARDVFTHYRDNYREDSVHEDYSGCWDIPPSADEFLDLMLVENEDTLKEIPVKDTKLLEKYDITEPGSDQSLFGMIVGAKELGPTYVGQCPMDFRAELNRVIERPVLLTIDQYNSFFGPSNFKDVYDHTIGAQELSMVRAFLPLHGLTNGKIVVANCYRHPFRSTMNRFSLAPFTLHIPRFSRKEFEQMIAYYRQVEWLLSDPHDELIDRFWALTSGRGDKLFLCAGWSGQQTF
eukprot:TRINITY_DN7142_c0_g1_i1.p1 TRINITY_DN7142_c0_g1~~TRINITY_DN7142_c0_g1_i1.p1  ORF type:complete len:440 (+),score=66.19 TRINITY_DN7142_c0_g1_i1:22-1341(+)